MAMVPAVLSSETTAELYDFVLKIWPKREQPSRRAFRTSAVD